MKTTYYDAEDYYFVKSKTNILKLSVQLGQEAKGGYQIFNGDRLLGANEPIELSQVDFTEDWITISAVILDKKHELTWSSVMVTLQEDSQIPKTFGPYRRKLDDLETVSYTIKIKIRE